MTITTAQILATFGADDHADLTTDDLYAGYAVAAQECARARAGLDTEDRDWAKARYLEALARRNTTTVIDYLTPEQTGAEAYENITLQVALNALGTIALREDYADAVRRPADTGFALGFGAIEEACTFPSSYLPRREREDAAYLLPWAA